MTEFRCGDKIPTVSGGTCEIIHRLGEGGQGIVYKCRYNGKDMALKWYFPGKLSNPNGFYSNILNNIKKGSPTSPSKGSPFDIFLWPIEITQEVEDSFGYIMDLRPSNYDEFSGFLLNVVKFNDMYTRLTAAINITCAFLELHRAGFSYQDLNDGNFFIRKDTGDVLICDNDNVVPFRSETSEVLGKMRYMAPEIVLGKKKPDKYTDRFSLAVILYMMLFGNHPFEGKKAYENPCMTDDIEKKIYGSEITFVWDPNDNSNRPVRGNNDNEIRHWPCYPERIRNLFIEAFDKERLTGSKIENDRVAENRFLDELVSLRDSIAICPKCGEEFFIDTTDQQSSCLDCYSTFPNPMMLKMGGFTIPLLPGKSLSRYFFEKRWEKISENYVSLIVGKKDPTKLGMRNESEDIFSVNVGGKIFTYEPGKTLQVLKGVKINFANLVKGEIV